MHTDTHTYSQSQAAICPDETITELRTLLKSSVGTCPNVSGGGGGTLGLSASCLPLIICRLVCGDELEMSDGLPVRGTSLWEASGIPQRCRWQPSSSSSPRQRPGFTRPRYTHTNTNMQQKKTSLQTYKHIGIHEPEASRFTGLEISMQTCWRESTVAGEGNSENRIRR